MKTKAAFNLCSSSSSSYSTLTTMDTITSDWSSLPRDILTSIAKRLHTRVDILRFRAVCRSFRCILPHPPHLLFPQSILSNLDFLKGPSPKKYDLFFPVESTLYAIQPLRDETSETWLVNVVESKPGRIQIKDPLSGQRFKKKLSKLPKSLNLLDYRVHEISRSHALESVTIYKGKSLAKQSYENSPNPFDLRKVIFSSFLDEPDDEFAVMAFGDYKLSVWRIIYQKWTNINIKLDFSEVFCDIIYLDHNHKFYALTSTGRTITVDSKSLTVTEVAARLLENPKTLLLCWVESFKALISLVVCEDDNCYVSEDDKCYVSEDGDADDKGYVSEFNNKDDEGYVSEDENTDDNSEYDKHCVRFFKLDEEKREWAPMVDRSELENMAFFASNHCLCSVSAKRLPGCKRKSLYFTDDSDDDEIDYPGEGAMVTNLEVIRPKKLSQFPGYSKIFWPPPTWLI